jgi:protein involved in polysaccharide export with SLBB domain
LEVYVVEDESFTGRYTVRPSGHIIFPKIGRVLVAGNTASGAEAAIKRSLEGTQLTSATVMVERVLGQGAVAPAGVTVFLSGTVQNPGRRTVPFIAGQRPTLYQAILEGGGFSRFANQKAVTISRQGQTGVKTIDVTGVRRGVLADVPLQDGDIIFVPEKTFGW